MSEGDQGYNPCPKLDDKVHVLVFVSEANKISLMTKEVVEKMKSVRRAACDLGRTRHEDAYHFVCSHGAPVNINLNNIQKKFKILIHFLSQQGFPKWQF